MSAPPAAPANHTPQPQTHRAAGGTPYTLLPDDSGIEIAGWRLERHKGPISNSATLDEFQSASSIHCPEMSFLSNHLTLRHAASGVLLRLDPRAALRACAHDKEATVPEPARPAAPTGRAGGAAGAAGVHPGVASRHPGAGAGVTSPPAARLQVAAASKWNAKSYEGLVEGGMKQVDFNFDWTYTTLYKGDLLQAPPEVPASAAAAVPLDALVPADERAQTTDEEIKVEMLQRPDPILWYDSIPLFEDELHDNGVASLTARVRVMEGCFLVLLQFWLRVDDMLCRVYDTRIFHQFGTTYAIREQTRREDTFDQLAKRGMPRTASLYSDPMVVSRKLTLQATEREKIDLTPQAQ